jgi:hypothetical protein
VITRTLPSPNTVNITHLGDEKRFILLLL